MFFKLLIHDVDFKFRFFGYPGIIYVFCATIHVLLVCVLVVCGIMLWWESNPAKAPDGQSNVTGVFAGPAPPPVVANMCHISRGAGALAVLGPCNEVVLSRDVMNGLRE